VQPERGGCVLGEVLVRTVDSRGAGKNARSLVSTRSSIGSLSAVASSFLP
jgi:hypothetical protein